MQSRNREKLIAALSLTTNGCLAELGYFPGITQKLEELIQINKQLKEENLQLFGDNRNLMVQIQKA